MPQLWTIPCKAIELILKHTLSLQIPQLINYTEKYCVDQPDGGILSEPVCSSRRWERHLYTKGKFPILANSATLKPTMSDI